MAPPGRLLISGRAALPGERPDLKRKVFGECANGAVSLQQCVVRAL